MADLAMQLQIYAMCHQECLFRENPEEGVLLRNVMHHFGIGLMGVIRGQFAEIWADRLLKVAQAIYHFRSCIL